MDIQKSEVGSTRRSFLKGAAIAGSTALLGRFVTGCAAPPLRRNMGSEIRTMHGPEIDLTIAENRMLIGGSPTTATAINGGVPGPLLRFREGEDILIRVRNELARDTSIHWHGVLVPPEMDGVPGVSFPGIPPGELFEYRFPLRQSGTYWYHSHSEYQEQTGLFGAIIIDPTGKEEHAYDREYVVVLSDWTYENPHHVFANLKKYGGYYNYQRRTLANIGEEAERVGFWNAVEDRLSWGRMRMDASDISDVTGATYTYLCNGLAPDENWRGLFHPGERIRLRFINASAATYFDVRIPGLPMQVIQADGIDVAPVTVDEFRLAIAETLDVIVTPERDAYTLFAEAMDRSGYARGTLATGPEGTAPTPNRRPRPLLTMQDMGMDHGSMEMGEGQDVHGGMETPASGADSGMKSMDHDMGAMAEEKDCTEPLKVVNRHNGDSHGAGNAMVAEVASSRIDDPGVGLRDAEWRVLTYADLRRRTPGHAMPAPGRDIELHLTGNMERYMWSIDGEQFHDDMPPILLHHNERVRFVLINDTMMAHPMHLHGMFFELEVGACQSNPLKHTVNVKPAERLSFIVTATEVGRWAFHCHILYHMDAGMFRVVEVKA